MARDARHLATAALIVSACAAALAGGGAGALAAGPLSGDPDGIALAHRVERAFGRITSYTEFEHNFVLMRAHAGRHGVFSWSWGKGAAPTGWVRATEHARVVVRAGRVVWASDLLVPDRAWCSGGRCVRYPRVQVLVDGRGQFFRFGTRGCFYRLAGTVPWHPGNLAYSVSGFVLDPIYQRHDTQLRYLYQWDSQRRAGETDIVDNASKLVSSGQTSLYAAGGDPHFVFDFTLAYPAHHPREPLTHLCAS